MPTELGTNNRQLTAVSALQHRRVRPGSGRFVIEGATLLEEALASGLALGELYVTAEALGARPALLELEQSGRPLYVIDRRAMRRISDLETPPGILAVVERPLSTLEALLAGSEPVLALAGVNDPGNAGTLVRSAEAFGVRRVLFGRGGVEPYHPKVVRAAMGALFRTQIAVKGGEMLEAAALTAGRPLIIADRGGEPLDRFRFPPGAVLVVGNERLGVRGWLSRWDGAVSIPQRGGESLNAAVAGSILLYALMLQNAGS